MAKVISAHRGRNGRIVRIACAALLLGGVLARGAEGADAIASSVFDDLANVVNDGRPAPVLRIVTKADGAWRIAWFDPTAGKRAVYIEQRTIDMCRTGALADRQRDCVAFILGHELAHYYKDHSRLLQLAQTASGSKGNSLTNQERQTLETQADEVGGYYSLLAGYDSLGISSQILDTAYAQFGVASDIPGYPSLALRKRGLDVARKTLSNLMPVFDAATILFFSGHYLEAAQCLDHVGRTFPSREVLNDSGVARLMAALEPLGKTEPFAFPVELDPESRLSMAAGRDVGVLPAKLATNALLSFEKSLAADYGYVPALINRSLALTMLRRTSESLGAADRAKSVALEKGDAAGAADASIAHGIAAHYAGDESMARRDFEAAMSDSPSLARENLLALNGSGAARRDPCADPRRDRERIAGEKPETMRAVVDPKSRMDVEGSIDSNVTLSVYTLYNPAYIGYVIELPKLAISALVTRPDYAGCSARGVCMGATIEQAIAPYFCPGQVGNFRQRSFATYPTANLVLDFGADKKLRRWITFFEDTL